MVIQKFINCSFAWKERFSRKEWPCFIHKIDSPREHITPPPLFDMELGVGLLLYNIFSTLKDLRQILRWLATLSSKIVNAGDESIFWPPVLSAANFCCENFVLFGSCYHSLCLSTFSKSLLLFLDNF
jgi:hypothetical protein